MPGPRFGVDALLEAVVGATGWGGGGIDTSRCVIVEAMSSRFETTVAPPRIVPMSPQLNAVPPRIRRAPCWDMMRPPRSMSVPMTVTGRYACGADNPRL